MTAAVGLREVIPSDLPIFYAQQRDPLANQMAAFPSRERPAFDAHWAKILADPANLIRTILYEGQVAGNVFSYELEGRREVGYWLGREFWDQGIATRALQEFLKESSTRPLYAHVARHNQGSIRVLEKAGFERVGEDISPFGEAGEEIAEWIYRLVRTQMAADLILRQATPADAPAVAEVYLASRKAFLPNAPLAHSDDDVRAYIINGLIPGADVFVAELDGQIVGMIALTREDQVGWIAQFYLHPTAVGQGIGTQLLAIAKGRLGPPIRLYTFQANLGAKRFYERHGFRAIAQGDGSENEERCPDILYEWSGDDGY